MRVPLAQLYLRRRTPPLGAQRTSGPPPSGALDTCGHGAILPAGHRWVADWAPGGGALARGAAGGRSLGRAEPRVGGALARASAGRARRWEGRRDARRRRSRKRCQMLGSRAGGLAAGGRGNLLFLAKSDPKRAAEAAAAEGERESEREREESACPRGAAARPRPPRDAR